MKNLYDLLGVRPDDNAENLRKAFRKAAKESHPDHHGGDPEAAARFRQIAEAYEILRNAEQRAAYDRLLEYERRPLRWKLKQATSDWKRHIVFDAMAGVVLAIMLAGGYELCAHLRGTPLDGAGGSAVRDPAETAAAVQPAGQWGAAGRPAAPQMPMLMPVAAAVATDAAASAANDGGTLGMARDEPVSNSSGQAVEVAGRDGDSDIPADQAGAGDPGKNPGGQPPDEHKVQSVEAQNAAAEGRDGVPGAPSPGVAASGNKRDGRTPEPGATAGDAKQLPEMKTTARSPAAKRQAATRPPFEQASLENKNPSACAGSQSCPGDVPPLFGVGY